jgi:hypothetical protein
MNKVSVYHLPFNIGFHSDRENWFVNREFYFEFETKKENEDAAEEAFVITNAPVDILTEEQKKLIKGFHGPSLSTGDVVKIENKLRISGDNHEPAYYLCKSFGWEKFDDNVIELIKYLKE